MSARVLFIGLDAAEPQLLDAGMRAGTLPVLARLAASGTSGPLANCMLTLPGAVWPEIASGVSCGKLPRFFHPRQVMTGEAAPRPLTPRDVEHDPTFWGEASSQGRRVAVVDIPHTPLARAINGMQVVEYGLHDHHFGSASHPQGLFDELQRRHGAYPVDSCDHRGGPTAANLILLDDLLAGIERKTAVMIDVLSRDDWDLGACAFSESHCGGHWFWKYSDRSHWGFVSGAPARLRDAVETIYARLDAAVGRLIDAARPDTTVVLASHGMAPYVAGYQMLPEVLARLGLGSGPARGRSLVGQLQITAKHWIPRRYWEALTRTLVEHPAARALVSPLQRRSGAMFFPLESTRTKAAYVPNNTIGAIRFNRRGREPFGCVEPGAEADRLAALLTRELLALRDPRSGEAIVTSVRTATDMFGSDHHPDVPDLIVQFRQDLGLLDTCESPAVGRVHVPVGSRWARRSGDHSPRSAVWLQGPQFGAGATLGGGNILDIAPTLLAALGCDLPGYLDGAPLVSE